MDASLASGVGSGAAPAPFLLKTYEMVDDSSTDEIVSWSSNNGSFVVWNPPEFARLLLPTYFKHNNFSSFIRQLNTYGFRKIDPERWEFANEGFVKDRKHLLQNIHRKKPIHSHSHPQGSLFDPERAALEEEIERLLREKKALEVDILTYKQQLSVPKLQLEDLMQRVVGMEDRQENMLTLLELSVQNRTFVEHLARKIESMDFSAYNKKRRLPQLHHTQPVLDSSSLDEHVNCRPDFGNAMHLDSSNNLNLELSPAISDINLVSCSTLSSNGDLATPPQKKMSEGGQKDAEMKTGGVLFAPETLDLSDTGTSFNFTIDSSLSGKTRTNEGTSLQQSLQKCLSATEENDYMSCHLNLSLAYSPLQVNEGRSSKITQPWHGIGTSTESKHDAEGKEAEFIDFSKDRDSSDDGKASLSSSLEAAKDLTQKPPSVQVRVNDVFWEQFLTEKPGSLDNEESNPKCGVNSYDKEDGVSGHGMSRNTKNMQQLTL